MISNFEKVKEFHTKFEQPIDVGFDYPVLKTRMTLIQEEFTELSDEYLIFSWKPENTPTNTKVNLVKELVDLLYVTYGALVELGVNADDAFSVVHYSNMSKLQPDGTIKKVNGKVIKPATYTPADLSPLLSD